MSQGDKDTGGQENLGVRRACKTGKYGETKGIFKAALESRTTRHSANMYPGGKGNQKTLGVGCVRKGAKMATGGSDKTPRESPMGKVADMALVQASDVALEKKVAGGQQDPGLGCARKADKYGETEGAVKAASEICTTRHGTDMAPEGIVDQKTPRVGGAHKKRQYGNPGEQRNPQGKKTGTTKDAALENINPRPDKVPALITGQEGSRVPRPHVSIPVYTPHGALSQKQTGSVGSPHIETRQTKAVANVGRNEDDRPPPPGLRDAHLGAKDTLGGGRQGNP